MFAAGALIRHQPPSSCQDGLGRASMGRDRRHSVFWVVMIANPTFSLTVCDAMTPQPGQIGTRTVGPPFMTTQAGPQRHVYGFCIWNLCLWGPSHTICIRQTLCEFLQIQLGCILEYSSRHRIGIVRTRTCNGGARDHHEAFSAVPTARSVRPCEEPVGRAPTAHQSSHQPGSRRRRERGSPLPNVAGEEYDCTS